MSIDDDIFDFEDAISKNSKLEKLFEPLIKYLGELEHSHEVIQAENAALRKTIKILETEPDTTRNLHIATKHFNKLLGENNG